MLLMLFSSTMSLHILASTPVVISLLVTAITGYFISSSMKFSSCALPSSLSPVIRIMYFSFLEYRSLFSLIRACLMRSACSISTQKTIVLLNLSVFFRNSVILAATTLVLSSITIFLSKSFMLYSLSSISYPNLSTLPASGLYPSKSLSNPIRITL